MTTRFNRLLALVLMFSVQFAPLGILPLGCESNGEALETTAAARGAHDMTGMASHAAMSNEGMTSHSHDAVRDVGGTSHDCGSGHDAPESGSHPSHCELAAPCSGLLFTSVGNALQLNVPSEHQLTVMQSRAPAAVLPAPDAPPPRA